jgi:hypothetical protein
MAIACSSIDEEMFTGASWELVMDLRRVFAALLGLGALAFPVLAHHSLSAEFDSEQRVRVTGIVTNVDWMNPHSYFFVDVKDPAIQKVRTWACELASPNELARRGFTRTSLKVGMSVTVAGTRAKDGSFKIHTDSLTADSAVLLGK